MNYFKELIDLLLIEHEEDKLSYAQAHQSSSIHERRLNGTTWYPVAIRSSEIGFGDYISVEFERPTHQDLPHLFRFGASVRLFSNLNAIENSIDGIIAFQGGNLMRVNFRKEELPEWTRDGKLGIDLLFDETSYKEMFSALSRASALQPDSKLIQILIGEGQPEFTPSTNAALIDHLNEKQREAVEKILSARQMAIIHGPPGTGKTTTLVEAIKAVWNSSQQRILMVAPSNTAVDVLSERLAAAGLSVLRIGNPTRVSEELTSLTLEGKMAGHESMKQIKELKKQANEYRRMAQQYKRHFGKAEREQRKALFGEARQVMALVEQTERYIFENILEETQVVTATLIGANYHTIKNLKFETVFIDEAAQALEPATWVPILKAKKVVFAGDHCQLPPTVKSFEASKKGLSMTLLEKCAKNHPEAVVLLEEQYRMHREIMDFPSRTFYDGKLKANEFVADRLVFPGDRPLIFIDTAGRGFDEIREETKISNPEEGNFLLSHLSDYLKGVHDASGFPPAIGIISPYSEQVSVLKEQILQFPTLASDLHNISINTIDGFQGQEKDIVYISLVRSNTENSIGFLEDTRRMNVAMTRAKSKLVMIGDSATLASHPFYERLVNHAQSTDSYQSAWEFL